MIFINIEPQKLTLKIEKLWINLILLDWHFARLPTLFAKFHTGVSVFYVNMAYSIYMYV